MWFENLTGFKEESPDQVRSNIEITGDTLHSKVNGAEYTFGKLEVSTLEELRNRAPALENYNSQIRLSEIVGDVQALHQEEENNGALFQAASQFNLLEMVGPEVNPERGVGIYEYDDTQGPACAIACGAGTIFRNYFAPVNGHEGQTRENQIDCLKDIGTELGNDKMNLWTMSNGYALANSEGLINVAQQINSKSNRNYEKLKSKLRIGIQWDTEVTINSNGNIVTQVYCSALPVAYSHLETDLWTEFAKLILDATYDATLYAALLNYDKTGNDTVYLTLVGGGAFGNKSDWIFEAIKKTIVKFSNTPLDVKIVSYGSSSAKVREFVGSIKTVLSSNKKT